MIRYYIQIKESKKQDKIYFHNNHFYSAFLIMMTSLRDDFLLFYLLFIIHLEELQLRIKLLIYKR